MELVPSSTELESNSMKLVPTFMELEPSSTELYLNSVEMVPSSSELYHSSMELELSSWELYTPALQSWSLLPGSVSQLYRAGACSLEQYISFVELVPNSSELGPAPLYCILGATCSSSLLSVLLSQSACSRQKYGLEIQD